MRLPWPPYWVIVACGSFLLAHFFRKENGETPEMLDDVLRRYQNLATINRTMAKRLKPLYAAYLMR